MKNGVSVGFGSLPQDVAGQTETHSDDKGNITFTVTFDLSKISGKDAFAIDAGHEGTHVDDIRNPLFANPETTLNLFQQEYRAYQTASFVAQGLNLGSRSIGGYEIWNSSWKEVDRVVLRDRGITNYLTTRPRNPLADTPPPNPWPN